MTDLQKQQVTEMRGNGSTYADISAALSLPVGTIKAYFSRNPISKTPTPVPAISPDIHEKPMNIGCKYCGKPLVNTPGHRQKTFCSTSCQRKYWRQNRLLMQHHALIFVTCSNCGKNFSDYAGHKRKYCSHSCYITHRYGGASDEPERIDLSCDNEVVSENG